MTRFMIISLLPHELRVLRSKNLPEDVEDTIINYALPYGSEWNRLGGARSIKLFPVTEHSICVGYTLVSPSLDHTTLSPLLCIASVQSAQRIDQLVQEGQDWIIKVVQPLLDEIEIDKDELRRTFKETNGEISIRSLFEKSLLTSDIVPGKPKIGLGDWLRTQFHCKITRSFWYSDSSSWLTVEERARLLYLATIWQRKIGRRLGISCRFPSFTTLSLSPGEFTDISFIAIPVFPRGDEY